MNKPYIKKEGKIAGFNIWIVDGNYIRGNIDEEFTNYGNHYFFNFIPKNEFWIDKETVKGEERFYVDNMLTVAKLMKEGKSYEEAVKKGAQIEKCERGKSKLVREWNIKRKTEKSLLNRIHKKLIKKYSKGKVQVWVVNGEVVRDKFFLDFTEGGHDKVYPFTPKNEIWIDDDISLRERKFILLHELHERNLMARGWAYDNDSKNRKSEKRHIIHESAHKSASKIEYFCRHHPRKLEEALRKEINEQL